MPRQKGRQVSPCEPDPRRTGNRSDLYPSGKRSFRRPILQGSNQEPWIIPPGIGWGERMGPGIHPFMGIRSSDRKLYEWVPEDDTPAFVSLPPEGFRIGASSSFRKDPSGSRLPGGEGMSETSRTGIHQSSPLDHPPGWKGTG
jgi:hypothetical protein